MFKKLLREFFLLSRGEQRAMILVSLLLILSLGARITVQMLPARNPQGMDQFLEESRQIIAAIAEADSISNVRQRTLDSIENLNKTQYRNRITGSYPSYRNHRDNPTIIQINSADSADLLPLPGIGPVFAGRIIKFRNMLGGFVSVDQLSEVYGLSEETIQQITPHIHVDTSEVRKLEINKASFRELLKHPYLEYEDVKALMHYLRVTGQVATVHELRQNMVLADSILDKIERYIDFSE